MDKYQTFHSAYDSEPYRPERDWVRDRPWDREHGFQTPVQSPYGYDEFFLWRAEKREQLAGQAPYAKNKPAKPSAAEYSDRLHQHDSEKFSAALKPVKKNKSFSNLNKRDCSKFLTAYYGRPIVAVALSQGCNVSSGQPFWVFWFRYKGE